MKFMLASLARRSEFSSSHTDAANFARCTNATCQFASSKNKQKRRPLFRRWLLGHKIKLFSQVK